MEGTDLFQIVRKEMLNPTICLLEVEAPFVARKAKPGQFIILRIDEKGDTGSLTIGGVIAVLAVIIHKELLVPILCGVFLVESLSVILQVRYFQTGKRKGVCRRLFKRTPIHDNFRMLPEQLDPNCHYVLRNWPHGAWHESKITVRFWIVTIILAATTIITLKIR